MVRLEPSGILPKPDLTALTGGYRQIPVAQVGAEIYCSSEMVMDLPEARIPSPSLTPSSGPGLGRGLAIRRSGGALPAQCRRIQDQGIVPII